jgi:hypothetical protein
VKLAEWESMAELRIHTLNYLRETEVDKSVDKVVKALCGVPEHRTIRLGLSST